jgi:hypothetical protein
MKFQTGLSQEQIEHIERLCFLDLVKVSDPNRHFSALFSPNLVLLALTWLWRYPPFEELAQEFNVTKPTVMHLIRSVLEIFDKQLQYLRKWRPMGRQRIKDGELKDSVGAIDTFPICIEQPPADERKQYYIYKRGHRSTYGWKVQIFTDFHGRINSVSAAYPYGSIADITLLRASEVDARLGPQCRALHFERDVEARMQARKAQHSEQEKESDTEEPTIIAALGDKAYQGHPYVKTPHKRYTGKRMTRKQKEYNRALSNARVIVENVNKRLEDFKILGTVYRGHRDSEFMSLIVRVVASLYNLKQETEPLRRFPKH